MSYHSTMVTDCIVCTRCINIKQKSISCTICHNWTHITCSHLSPKSICNDYICTFCLCSTFPFNYLSDDTEFLCLLSNFFGDFPLFNNHDLNGARLSILNNIDLLDDQELNADANFYNNYDLDSKYYLPEAISAIHELKVTNEHFSIVHLNARSILHKLDHLETLLNIINLDVDIIAVSETWETDINANLINIHGYNKFSKHRTNNDKGGGVALFVRKSLDYSPINHKSTLFESAFIELKVPYQRPIIIGAIYRPPGGNLTDFNQEYETAITNLIGNNKKGIILAGDFNINLMNHSCHMETENFLNIMFAHNMLPMIKRPTRYGDCCATLIDNIFTNQINETHVSGIILDDMSDHLPIFLIMQKELPVKKKFITKSIRSINEATISNLSTKLEGTDWSVLDSKGVNEAYDTFCSMFRNMYDEALPIELKKYKIHSTKHKPWITTSILNSVRKKHKLYKKYLSTKSQTSKENYLKYKNKLTKIIRAAEKKYYSDKFCYVKDNIRDTWKLINKVLNETTGSGHKPTVTKIKDKNLVVNDPKVIADKFNEYFVNIGPNLAKNIPEIPNRSITDTLPQSVKNSIFLSPCTSAEILNIVATLKNSKGLGVDGFSTPVIKQVIMSILSPLTVICNKSLDSGIFPDSMKSAKVIPVYKSDDKLLVSNYRPISVLPIFSKILEKIVYSRLESFIAKHNIFCENQFGFREKHSTYMALLNIIDQITEQLDSKAFSLGIFIDLSKAFDTIDHKILLTKLEIYGVRGIALNWFRSYLSNRTQLVEIDGNPSSLRKITCGVPQGSILGPLLFILYVNDIVRVSSIMKCILFADDTNLLLNDTNLNNLIKNANIEIQKISDWLKINKLSLNIKKTHFILFHFHQRKLIQNLSIRIDDCELERVSHTKFLGIILHENLSWKKHVSVLANKINKNIGILKVLQSKLPISALFMLYNTLIYPYLQYCNIAWASKVTTHIDSLNILQRKALRVVCKANWQAHSTPLFYSLHTLKLSDINKLQTGCFMYNAINNLLPSLFSGYFTLNINVHHYFTRQSKNIHQTSIRTSLRKFNIKNFGTSLWNSLPIMLKNKPSIHSFKAAYKQFLLSSYVVA